MSIIKLQKSHLKKMLGYTVAIISLIFIIRVFLSMEVNILSLLKQPQNYLLIFVFIAITTATSMGQGCVWRILLSFIGKKNVPLREVVPIYLRANIAKYIPGNVMHFAGRNLLGTKLGISQVDIALATVGEVLVMALSSLILVLILAWSGLVTLATMIWETLAYRYTLLAVFLIGILLVCICGVVLYKKPKLWEKYQVFLSKKFISPLVTCLCISSASFLVYGIVFLLIFLLVLGVDTPTSYYLPTISMMVLSWIAGHLIPGVPGGIGVRESITILLVAPMYGAEAAALASVFQRVVSVIADMLGFLASFLFSRNEKQSIDPDSEQSTGGSEL